MATGDLLSIPSRWRGIPYRHFGIDIGDGTVVHLATHPERERTMEVQRVSMADFADGKEVLVETVSDSLPAEEVVRRALDELGSTDYHLLLESCEHFARHCKSGEHVSHQSGRVLRGAMRVGLAGVLTYSTRVASFAVASGLPRAGLMKSAGLSSLLGEVARQTAYVASRHVDIEHRHADSIGRSVGVTTAAVTGLVVAGPVGGAASAAVYLTIDAVTNAVFLKSTKRR